MSLFDTHNIGLFAHSAGIPVSVLNERELLKFARSVEQHVTSAIKTDPNVYEHNHMDVERAFKLAVANRGIHLLDDMKVPVEQRPEGELKAVARGLYLPGEPSPHEGGVAPGFYEQFYQEFGRLKPRFIAFMEVQRYKTVSSESFESKWSFKIRFASIK